MAEYPQSCLLGEAHGTENAGAISLRVSEGLAGSQKSLTMDPPQWIHVNKIHVNGSGPY